MRYIFDKNIDPNCEYCEHSLLDNENQGDLICLKKKQPVIPCKKFKYAPLKRIPRTFNMLNFENLSQEDFTLD